MKKRVYFEYSPLFQPTYYYVLLLNFKRRSISIKLGGLGLTFYFGCAVSVTEPLRCNGVQPNIYQLLGYAVT